MGRPHDRDLGRVDDYLDMGVATVWIVDPIDPRRREAYQIDESGTMLPQTSLLSVPGTAIALPVSAMFDCLAVLPKDA